MLLKQATTADISPLMRLITDFYTYFGYSFNAEKHEKMVLNFLENPHYGSIWLAEINEKPVAYIALTYGFTFEYGGRDAFIDEFFVAETHRNTGLGGVILAQIQAKMPELGLCALHLHTEAYNTRAKVLYEKSGFQDYKRSTLTFLGGR
jgi:GNAT superfamily N-acetyltransferase